MQKWRNSLQGIYKPACYKAIVINHIRLHFFCFNFFKRVMGQKKKITKITKAHAVQIETIYFETAHLVSSTTFINSLDIENVSVAQI